MKLNFFARAALISVTVAAAASICFAAEKTLNVKVPEQLDVNKVFMLICQQSEKCGSFRNNKMRDHKNELSFPIEADTKSVKLYIFYPGYKIITTELKAEDISSEKPLCPKFEKLPTVPVTIKLTKSDGTAIANQQVYFSQPRAEADYFELMDYKFRPDDAAPVASGLTDANGLVTLIVPQLLDDPFFSKPGGWSGSDHSFRQLMSTANYEVSLDWMAIAYRLEPGFIKAKRSYPELQVIKMIHDSEIINCEEAKTKR